MFGRLGFLGRLLLIVLALLLAFLVLAVAISFLARERKDQGAERFPIPAQAAAIVELLDRTPDAERPLVLKAVSNERFIVSLSGDAPPNDPLLSRMPAVEWLVTQYLETLPGREVKVYLGKRQSEGIVNRLVDRLSQFNATPVSIQVSLQDGSFAIFQLRGDGSRRIFGIPVGFFLGVIGCLFAALAMWAIIREARPLTELAQSVEKFSQDGTPRAIAPQGAPEIKRLVGAINDMQSRIAALLRGRTMLLGAISHDLKTYVTRLRLRAEFIEPGDQQARAVRDLDDMTALIDSALAVARGSLTSDRRDRVDFRELVIDEVGRRSTGAITVSDQSTDGGLVVEGDAVALRSVIANLLDNAERYANHAGVSVGRSGDRVELFVEDDGPGIAEGEREMVFEPFYRVDSSRSSSTGGSGLGLAITKQIVEAHGGSIKLEASDRGGARFSISLPSAQAQ